MIFFFKKKKKRGRGKKEQRKLHKACFPKLADISSVDNPFKQLSFLSSTLCWGPQDADINPFLPSLATAVLACWPEAATRHQG